MSTYFATIIVDNFTTAFSTVAFQLSMLPIGKLSATQYALLASLGNFGRTTLASFSGELVDFPQWLVNLLYTDIINGDTEFDHAYSLRQFSPIC